MNETHAKQTTGTIHSSSLVRNKTLSTIFCDDLKNNSSFGYSNRAWQIKLEHCHNNNKSACKSSELKSYAGNTHNLTNILNHQIQMNELMKHRKTEVYLVQVFFQTSAGTWCRIKKCYINERNVGIHSRNKCEGAKLKAINSCFRARQIEMA